MSGVMVEACVVDMACFYFTLLRPQTAKVLVRLLTLLLLFPSIIQVRSASMASTLGDNAELLAASLESQAVNDQSVMDVSDDSQLIEAARAGDRAAFGELYD